MLSARDQTGKRKLAHPSPSIRLSATPPPQPLSRGAVNDSGALISSLGAAMRSVKRSCGVSHHEQLSF